MQRIDYRKSWARAQLIHDAAPPLVIEVARPWGLQLGIDLTGKPRCLAPLVGARRGACQMPAGGLTSHPGTGRCQRHRGNTPRGETEGFMIMGIAYARRLAISPAEALLNEVHRSAGAVEFLEAKLADAQTVTELLDSYAELVAWYERERAFGLKVNVAAINAGVMTLLAEQISQHGVQIAQLMSQTLDALELTPEQEARARTVLADRMRSLALTAAQNAHDAAHDVDSTERVDNSTGLD